MNDRLEFFLHLQDCNRHMDYSCFDVNLENILESSEGSSDLNKFLFDNCIDKNAVIASARYDRPLPMVVFGKLSVGWIFVPYTEQDSLQCFHTLGPFFSSVLSELFIQRQLQLLTADLPMQHLIRKYLPGIPVCSVHSLQIIARQFYYCFYEKILPQDNYLTIGENSTKYLAVTEIENKTYIPHSPYQLEKQIFEAVERGESYNEYGVSRINLSGYQVMPTTGDPLRDCKNSAYTTNVLACRAAIRGGVPPVHAYAISDMYIQLIEQQASANDVMAMSQRIIDDYTRTVKEYQDSSETVPVKEVIAFIRTRIYEKVSLADIAAELGYNKNYLAGIFKKETGKTVGQYIMECKIRYAKTLLLTHQFSCAEISHQLCFSSESHFSQVFRRETGMTPTEFSNSQW